jgi:aspartokinase/homoserine dehydrogenase 1
MTGRLPIWRICKFGGSSLATSERIAHVVDRINDLHEPGSSTAVVVSAMGNDTDSILEAATAARDGDVRRMQDLLGRIASRSRSNAAGLAARHQMPESLLLELTRALNGVLEGQRLDDRLLDYLLSFGERISASVVSAHLVAAGIDAWPVDARDWLRTNNWFGGAEVLQVETDDRIASLRRAWEGRVTVHTGFIGATKEGQTTTLGRNGSDYTATLLARALCAAEVSIFTESPGVMTADPMIVPESYPITRMSYEEALELASFGARMFHPQTMIPLIELGIPMRIRSTFRRGDPGTSIGVGRESHDASPISVTSLENLAALNINCVRISNEARIGQRVLSALQRQRITIWMTVQAAHGQVMSLVVPLSKLHLARSVIESELEADLASGAIVPVHQESPVTLLTLVGDRVSAQSNVAGRFFCSLGEAGINVRAIGQGVGSSSISAVISSTHTAKAVRTVHAAFNFAEARKAASMVASDRSELPTRGSSFDGWVQGIN